MMVLALKDDFVGGLLPRKLGPHLVCQRDKKMFQPPSKLVYLRANNLLGNIEQEKKVK